MMDCLMFLAGLLIGFWCCYVRTLEIMKEYSKIILDLEKLSRIDKSTIFRFQKKVLSDYIPEVPRDTIKYLNAIALNKYLSDRRDEAVY